MQFARLDRSTCRPPTDRCKGSRTSIADCSCGAMAIRIRTHPTKNGARFLPALKDGVSARQNDEPRLGWDIEGDGSVQPSCDQLPRRRCRCAQECVQELQALIMSKHLNRPGPLCYSSAPMRYLADIGTRARTVQTPRKDLSVPSAEAMREWYRLPKPPPFPSGPLVIVWPTPAEPPSE